MFLPAIGQRQLRKQHNLLAKHRQKPIINTVLTLQVQNADGRVVGDRLHHDGQRDVHALRALGAGLRLLRDLADGRAADLVAGPDQVVHVPHVLLLLANQRHRPARQHRGGEGRLLHIEKCRLHPLQHLNSQKYNFEKIDSPGPILLHVFPEDLHA